MSSHNGLFVQCNPLLDLTADVDEEFLKKHNLSLNTEEIYSARFRGLFEDLEALPGVTRTAGGAGLNTARVAQWVLNKHAKAGGESGAARPQTTYVGCIGDDERGRVLRQHAEADGVHMDLEVIKDHPTGICAVCRHDQVRSLVANLGAAQQLAPAYVASPAVQESLRSAAVAFTTAYAAPFHVKSTMALASATRRGPTAPLFALACSSKQIMETFGEDLVDVLTSIDLVFGNQEEIRDLALILQWVPTKGMSDQELATKIAREMPYDKAHPTRVVVMTRGRHPVVFGCNDGVSGDVPVCALRDGRTKHTHTGAGDAFIGGFLAAWVAGQRNSSAVEHCVQTGVKAATYVIDNTIKTLPPDDAPDF